MLFEQSVYGRGADPDSNTYSPKLQCQSIANYPKNCDGTQDKDSPEPRLLEREVGGLLVILTFLALREFLHCSTIVPIDEFA